MPPLLDRKRIRRARLVDGVMRRLITLGGVAVVLAVAGILVLILRETWPLFRAASVREVPEETAALHEADSRPVAVGVEVDWRGDRVVAGGLDARGRAGALTDETAVSLSGTLRSDGREEAPIAAAWPLGRGREVLLWDDGAATLAEFALRSATDGVANKGDAETRSAADFSLRLFDAGFGPARLAMLDGDAAEGTALFVGEDNRIRARRWATRRAGIRRVKTEATVELVSELGAEISCVVLLHGGSTVYAGTRTGEILAWRFPDDMPPAADAAALPRFAADVTPANRTRRAITALAALEGDAALAAGDADGGLSVWHESLEGGRHRLVKAQDWPAAGGGVRSILPSGRSRTFAALDADGGIRLRHATNGRVVADIPPPSPAPFGGSTIHTPRRA